MIVDVKTSKHIPPNKNISHQILPSSFKKLLHQKWHKHKVHPNWKAIGSPSNSSLVTCSWYPFPFNSRLLGRWTTQNHSNTVFWQPEIWQTHQLRLIVYPIKLHEFLYIQPVVTSRRIPKNHQLTVVLDDESYVSQLQGPFRYQVTKSSMCLASITLGKRCLLLL